MAPIQVIPAQICIFQCQSLQTSFGEVAGKEGERGSALLSSSSSTQPAKLCTSKDLWKGRKERGS